MADEVHVEDVGTRLRILITDDDVAVDVSSATVQEVRLKKPDGTLIQKDSSFVNTGTDGLIQYIVESGVLDGPGTWKIQGYVELGVSNIFHTKFKSFTVHRNL